MESACAVTLGGQSGHHRWSLFKKVTSKLSRRLKEENEPAM